jgi:flagellar biosynthetic protein FlhB
MADEKTEQPTAKKLKDAREKGQIPRSKDLSAAAATLMGVLVLGRMGGILIGRLTERMASALTHVGDHPVRSVTAGELTGVVLGGAGFVALVVGPIAIATTVTGVLLQGVQGGWNFAPAALQWDLARLSPASGIKKLFSVNALVDTLKTYIAVAVICYATWSTIDAVIHDATRLAWMTPMGSASAAWGHTEALLWKIAWALLVLGAADYGLQWYRHMSSLKMTKQEVRDESKQSDGSPEVKGKIKRIQRDMARRRMINDVARATVVVTNPTHFAVALEYKRGVMAAPIVLAKGADHIALAIREQAKKHGVPMVENKPLARALFAEAEVGQSIPANLFAAVAEVLAQLVRLKQLVL